LFTCFVSGFLDSSVDMLSLIPSYKKYKETGA